MMNEQAEYMLIGSILKDNSILGDLTLTPTHFEDLTNRNIYQAMLNIKKKGYPIDAASLKDELGDGYIFIGGDRRIEELKECVPSTNAYKSYEQMVINQWKIREAKQLINESKNHITLEKIQELVKKLTEIDEQGTQEEFNLNEHLQNMYDVVTIETPLRRSGVPSGYTDIDNKTDGFQPNDLVIVGARPSMGKTAFMLNLALNCNKEADKREKEIIPIVFSLEMSAESLIRRMLSSIARINGLKLKNPYHYMNDKEKEDWIKAIGVLERLDLKIFDKPRQKVAEMKSKVRKVKHDNPNKDVIVFIDYLTLIKPTQDYKGNTHAAVTEISADLKAMAKEFKCPVVCLAQLSRGVEQRQDKRPMMSDLRESGSIEQDADVIMLLYRDEYYNETNNENQNVLEVNVAKNRDGAVGVVKLLYKKEINRIESLYHR